MAMYGKQRIIWYVVLALIVIGIITSLVENPGRMLLPVLILGGVFLLYKFPPAAFKRQQTPRRGPIHMSKAKPKRKNPFRVIDGNRKDDDDTPKYH
jgi:hypothetical protein